MKTLITTFNPNSTDCRMVEQITGSRFLIPLYAVDLQLYNDLKHPGKGVYERLHKLLSEKSRQHELYVLTELKTGEHLDAFQDHRSFSDPLYHILVRVKRQKERMTYQLL